MALKQFTITKVVSSNIVFDIFSNIQNFFGGNLTKYEKMINKAINQIEEETKNISFSWFRYEITQLTNGAVAVMLYGELL